MLIAMLTTLAAAVLFVACPNVAGLLTSRASARARKMAMRLAIGAGRARLIRQLMTESLLIALAGGTQGLAFGYGAIKHDIFRSKRARGSTRARHPSLRANQSSPGNRVDTNYRLDVGFPLSSSCVTRRKRGTHRRHRPSGAYWRLS
jgi:hypothetical protein